MMDFIKKRWQRRKGKGVAGKGKNRPLTLEGWELDQGVTPRPREVKRKILVVGKDSTFSTGVMDYAVNLAERLGYDLIALNVNPDLGQTGRYFSPYKQYLREKFAQRAAAAWEVIQRQVAGKGIHGEQLVKFGDVDQAVKDLNHEIKRIDFVITEADIRNEEITGEIPLPVFSIAGYQGEKVMTKEHESARNRPWGKTIAFGAITAVLYAAVFTNGATVMNFFTKGGWYAALPIATAFIFSFAHGAFANYLWSCLGIEAVKRVQPRPEAKRPVARKRPRPQLRLNA